MIFLSEKNLLKKVESSLNKNMIFLQSLLCREIVEELCDKKSEDKEMYIQKIRLIEIEKNKLAASFEAKTTNSIKTELLNDSLKQSRIDFLQQEYDSLKEKVFLLIIFLFMEKINIILKLKNLEISVQKNSTENCKLKEGFQIKIEIISVEKEEMAKDYERSIAELKENIEKIKKV